MNEIKNLQKFLEENKNKKIIVVGTTCTGKSTLLKNITNAQDMDELIFSKLTKEETEYVCENPWTEEIGNKMNELVNEKIKVEKGKPLFGTVVLDCDIIVYLDISDRLLKERVLKRKTSFENAKNMQKQILKNIKKSNIPVIKYKVI